MQSPQNADYYNKLCMYMYQEHRSQDKAIRRSGEKKLFDMLRGKDLSYLSTPAATPTKEAIDLTDTEDTPPNVYADPSSDPIPSTVNNDDNKPIVPGTDEWFREKGYGVVTVAMVEKVRYSLRETVRVDGNGVMYTLRMPTGVLLERWKSQDFDVVNLVPICFALDYTGDYLDRTVIDSICEKLGFTAKREKLGNRTVCTWITTSMVSRFVRTHNASAKKHRLDAKKLGQISMLLEDDPEDRATSFDFVYHYVLSNTKGQMFYEDFNQKAFARHPTFATPRPVQCPGCPSSAGVCPWGTIINHRNTRVEVPDKRTTSRGRFYWPAYCSACESFGTQERRAQSKKDDPLACFVAATARDAKRKGISGDTKVYAKRKGISGDTKVFRHLVLRVLIEGRVRGNAAPLTPTEEAQYERIARTQKLYSTLSGIEATPALLAGDNQASLDRTQFDASGISFPYDHQNQILILCTTFENKMYGNHNVQARHAFDKVLEENYSPDDASRSPETSHLDFEYWKRKHNAQRFMRPWIACKWDVSTMMLWLRGQFRCAITHFAHGTKGSYLTIDRMTDTDCCYQEEDCIPMLWELNRAKGSKNENYIFYSKETLRAEMNRKNIPESVSLREGTILIMRERVQAIINTIRR
ncbi:hypothetical protein HDU87_006012 [Geranomyces variabilis]|uniref:Uncharacterized protein n=1 Tax=Geranomyces variabilis TaxID=109894 RepID=A0AAD5XT97_9FUNG|nr:hypothetical protein HDU87_006012 [Geranomyces variabilis]